MTRGPYVGPSFSLGQQTDRVIQRAGKNDDYSAIADVDAIFLAAGEDEPVRKGTAFQVLCPRLSVSPLLTVIHPADMASWIRVSFHVHSVSERQDLYPLLCNKRFCCTGLVTPCSHF